MSGELVTIYSMAVSLARKNQQITGEKNEYYVTLAQLEGILKAHRESKSE